MKETLKEMWKPKYKVISPKELIEMIFTTIPRYHDHQQHDAHEFLRLLLDYLSLELLSSFPSFNNINNNIDNNNNNNNENYNNDDNIDNNDEKKEERGREITDLFRGTLVSEIICNNCQFTSSKSDPFLDLSLDLVFPNSLLQNNKNKNKKNNKNNIKDNNNEEEIEKGEGEEEGEEASVEESLVKYFGKEEIKNNVEKCENCGEIKKYKKFSIEKSPPILCLHLKRFKWDLDQKATKINSNVVFPFDLNLNSLFPSINNINNNINYNIINDNLDDRYQLFAFVNHIGSGFFFISFSYITYFS